MRRKNTEGVMTTGEIARACRVSTRLVIKWCDDGLLKFWTLPASDHRRVLVEEFERFVRLYNIPVNGANGHDYEKRKPEVLLVGCTDQTRMVLQRNIGKRVKVLVADNLVVVNAPTSLRLVVLDCSIDESAMKSIYQRCEQANVRTVMLLNDDTPLVAEHRHLLQCGFLTKPIDPDAVLRLAGLD